MAGGLVLVSFVRFFSCSWAWRLVRVYDYDRLGWVLEVPFTPAVEYERSIRDSRTRTGSSGNPS